MGIFDSMLVKYGAVMVGYAVVGLPVFGPGSAKYLAERGTDQALITKDYIRNSSLLINLAKAIGRLVVSYKEVQNLAGYTTLVPRWTMFCLTSVMVNTLVSWWLPTTTTRIKMSTFLKKEK